MASLDRLRAVAPADCPVLALRDRRLVAWGAAWSLVALVAYGLVAAIIPNPVFGRQIPPTTASIVIWLVSAPLIGLVTATYTVPVGHPGPTPLLIVDPEPSETAARAGGIVGTVAGVGAFLAIGCPVCNKVALVLLGASGALSVWAPIQPIIGALSVLLLAATVLWRLRLRASGGACPI